MLKRGVSRFNMKSLLQIKNFGAIDADNDDILLKCFEDHEAFIELLNLGKFLVIGRKGSGKTAIFKKLLTIKEYNFFSIGHTFSDYPWYLHDKQARIGMPDYDKFNHSWKYLILMTLSKVILNKDQSIPFDEQSRMDIKKVEKFVVDTYGTKDPDITQIFTPTKSLKLNPSFSIDTKILKAGISPTNVPMSELPTIIQDVNRNLLEFTLSCLNSEHTYHICFDQLDLGFDPKDTEYSNRLVGLLLACRDLNVRAREEGKKLFVSVFLRDDIYNGLHFEDKNKLTENYVSRIEWDTPRTGKSLEKLMEKRFIELLRENEDELITWRDVFNEEKQMPGHQSKYQYLIDRTYLRPRDIIKFCNEVLSQYKNRMREQNQTGDHKFNNIDINRAKAEYSDYFLNELDDEINKHIPEYKNYLEIFKALGVQQFSRDEYVKVFDSRKASFPSVGDPMDILRDLFNFSIIGFYRAGGKGYGGSEYVYRYKDQRAQFDENAQQFRLHPGLTDVLGLRRYSFKNAEG